jgi:hypothetical protein
MSAIVQQGVLLPQQQTPYVFIRSKDAYRGPDPYRVKDQLTFLQDAWMKYGPERFMLHHCWIQRKQPEQGEKEILPSESLYWNRNLVPFALNSIQQDIESKLGSRNIFLKPRQAGYTTYMIIRRLFLPCILNPGHNGLLISQTGEYATAHFRMLKRVCKLFAMVDPYDRKQNFFAEELHANLLHTVASNRKEIIFDQLDCSIRCASAEVEEVGQGLTLQHVVATEVARWEGNPEATLANMKAAIPKDGTFDMESTANGHGGYFFEECMRAREVGKGYREFTYHFHEWFWHDEYYLDNPVKAETLTKDELMVMGIAEEKHKKLSLYQIAWRRKQKEDYRGDFDEKYPENDMDCFLLTGGAFFDKEIVRYRYKELLANPIREKYAKLQVYKTQKPHRQYVIGADVASGLEVGTGDLDWSVASVIDLDTGEQCAEYRSQLLPEEFGWDLADLGERYNNALIAVERNNEGGTVILTLERACSYMNLYKHLDWTRRELSKRGKGGTQGNSQGRLRELLGFPTTPKTRPLALNRFRFYLSEHPDKVNSLKLLEECSTFVRNQDKQGRPEADVGCHDDCVLAISIAQYVRAVKLGYLPTETLPHREKYGEIPQEFQPDSDAAKEHD